MSYRVAQIRYAWFERVAMRVLFALTVYSHVPNSLSQRTISSPHGLARLIDLRFLLEPSAFAVCRYLLWAALVLYVVRVAWSIALPYMTLLSIAAGTIANSEGAIGHSLQIVSLVLGAQTAAHFYDLFQRRRAKEDWDNARGEDRVISWSQQAIVAAYLASALTKLVHTSGMWFFRSPMVAVQIIKTKEQDFYDRLDVAHHNAGLSIAEWVVAHPIPLALVLGCGLILELTAPVALLGRRYALFYGLGLVVFHESVQRLMKLNFIYNEYLLWIYLVNIPFWLWVVARWLRIQPRGNFPPGSRSAAGEW
jgi:hypothetical protein